MKNLLLFVMNPIIAIALFEVASNFPNLTNMQFVNPISAIFIALCTIAGTGYHVVTKWAASWQDEEETQNN